MSERRRYEMRWGSRPNKGYIIVDTQRGDRVLFTSDNRGETEQRAEQLNKVAKSPFVPSRKYSLLYQLPTWRKPRQAVMVYLGKGGLGGDDLMFDARPAGGTQPLQIEWILFSEPVHQDTPCFLNRRTR